MNRTDTLRLPLAAAIVLLAAQATSGEETPAPLPMLRIIFFTPADVEPPAGVARRLTQIADYTEQFFNRWMKRWGYAPANPRVFRRNEDGTAEVLWVKGEQPVSSGRYDGPGFEMEAIEKAVKRYQVPRHRHVWWIFVYLGDPPRRFANYRGQGDSRDGGWAIVNYSSTPGEIRPGSEMAGGFNDKLMLKGCIHELGHAFGLPHIGPNPRLGLGNSLMGPQTEIYGAQGLPGKDRVYLTPASAAILWKHPVFSGTARDRSVIPGVQLSDFRAVFDPKERQVVVSGKLTSDVPSHSIVVIDDMERKPGPYWVRSYVGRLGDDGTFRVTIDEPVPSDGRLKIAFCFNNGAVTGGGRGGPGQSLETAIVKPYRFERGGLRFER